MTTATVVTRHCHPSPPALSARSVARLGRAAVQEAARDEVVVREV